MHSSDSLIFGGQRVDVADKVVIMIHGRGASAQSILGLSQYFPTDKVAYLAPQATGGTWYPYSFLAPMDQNEPGLSSGLQVIGEIVDRLIADYGVSKEKIYFLGFSQGACLALEYVARNAARYGGVFGLSGGLIGPEGTPRDYHGSFDGTRVFLGCSDIDSHIPKERVLESGEVFKKMSAETTVRLYKNFGHSINEDEIDFVSQILA